MKLIDLTGQRFGKRLVLGRSPRQLGEHDSFWICQCDCGHKDRAGASALKSGKGRCGKCRRMTHGQASRGRESPEYSSWRAMMERCYNSKHEAYERYAGRGIVVCERWHSVLNFMADMPPRPSGFTLERKDNSGNYEPGNCEWATRKTQARNRRNNKLLTWRGHTQPVSVWAEELGLEPDTLSIRLRKGWSIQRAMTEPLHQEKRRYQ